MGDSPSRDFLPDAAGATGSVDNILNALPTMMQLPFGLGPDMPPSQNASAQACGGIAEATARERMYLRHGRMYEADCLFELVAYKPALKLYEEAVGAHQDTASALTAYVQIINCHVFLGQMMDARAALARAEILVDRIPDMAFASPLSLETRSDWKRYFQWLRDSEFLGKHG